MVSLEDGRSELWQWDTGRIITVDKDCSQVHFSNKLIGRSFDVDVVDGKAYIPDLLLQVAKDINVWGFMGDPENGYTKFNKTFKVNSRNKPAEYVFTQTEQITMQMILDIAQSVRDDADAGVFDGPPGPKGDAGAIEFVVVNELPAIGDGSKIYLMLEENAEEPNRFGEYVFIDGAWERIGSAGVEVNLEEYVKNTDYATQDKAGVVFVHGTYGVATDTGGLLYLSAADNTEISEKKNNYKPITSQTMDFAVKNSLTTNANELTDEEKANACSWMGAVKEQHPAFNDGAIRGYAYAINPSGEQVLSPMTIQAVANTIAYRNPSGNIYVSEPLSQYEAINRGYLDKIVAELVARIEALESMLNAEQ